MSQISRRQLNSRVQERIYEIFVDVVREANTSSEVHTLLEDFLTPTERVMLPKRLCIAYLLLKKYNQRAISSYLKVSFTTINRVSTALTTGGQGYTLMLTRLQKREKIDAILKQIEEGIVSTLASIGGPTHVWKGLQSIQRKKTYKEIKTF
ncbi:MAG: hypothetical protein ACD_48C00152G0007 [uncultured bacterium]|nr:MAG: hypothetical protein ACD_48C00152G0007 [uncultured bacterium]